MTYRQLMNELVKFRVISGWDWYLKDNTIVFTKIFKLKYLKWKK